MLKSFSVIFSAQERAGERTEGGRGGAKEYKDWRTRTEVVLSVGGRGGVREGTREKGKRGDINLA